MNQAVREVQAVREARAVRAVPTARQHGFSLVEVMISTVVALMATLAIMQSFAVSEGYRRTAASGGDATFSGAVGIYLLGRDLQVAGYGINTSASTYLGCAVSGIDEGGSAPRAFNFTLAPVQVAFGASASAPDQITVVSGNSPALPGPVDLTSTMAANTSDYQIDYPFGVTAGDVMVLAQAGQPCTLVQATNTPTTAAAGSQNTLKHVSGRFTGTGGVSTAARYNPSAGIGPAYAAGAVMMDLGTAPTVNTYYIQNGTLVFDQPVQGVVAQPAAANVVQLKAIYGKDPGVTGAVTTWNTTAPVTAADWASVLAVRVALVARSAQPEKPATVGGPCATTTAFPSVTWDDGTTTVLDLSASAPTGPAWQCYRYKVFHMTASLRNLIWTPS